MAQTILATADLAQRFRHAPNMVRQSRCHRRRCLAPGLIFGSRVIRQRCMDTAEVIVREPERESRFMIRPLFRVRAGQSRHAPIAHSDIQILPFGE